MYVQHLCTQPVSVQPALKVWRRPIIGAQWLLFKSGPAASNHFEAGGFVRSNDEVAYPNLMFHFLPLAVRYDGSQPTGAHGYQVHVGPMYSDARGSLKIKSTRSAAASGAALQLPVDRAGPARVGRGDPGRALDPRAAGVRAVRRRRDLARRRGGDRRADPRLGRARRRDGAAPLVHLPDGRRRRIGHRPRTRCASTASTACAWSTRASSRTSRTATSTRRC